MRAVIVYCIEGWEEFIRNHTVRLGISKVILLRSNIKLLDMFKGLKIAVKSETLPSEDITTIVDLIVKAIISLRSNGYEPIIFLPPLEPKFIIAMYIAACIEKITVIAPEEIPESPKKFEINQLELPLFPFVELRNNEKFVLDEIHRLVQARDGEDYSIIFPI